MKIVFHDVQNLLGRSIGHWWEEHGEICAELAATGMSWAGYDTIKEAIHHLRVEENMRLRNRPMRKRQPIG